MTHKKFDDPLRRKPLRVFYTQKPWCFRKRLGRELVHHALRSWKTGRSDGVSGDLCHPHASDVCGKKLLSASDSGNTDAIAVLLESKSLSETLLLARSSDASGQLYDRITFFNPPNLLAPFVSAMRQHRST